MSFVLVQRGKALGPLCSEEIVDGIADESITANAKIWRPPWPSWLKITEVFPKEFGLTGDLFEELEHKGETSYHPVESFLDRVEKVVPTQQIESLLRQAKEEAKDPREVKITSDSKRNLVKENLRTAIAMGHLEKADVAKLAEEFEETGAQRIFLYRLRQEFDNGKLDLSFEGISARVLGAKWRKIEFPIFHQLPPKPEVGSLRPYMIESDSQPAFRLGFRADQADGWLMRVNDTVRINERVGKHQTSDESITTQVYTERLQDAICVFRYWSHLKILELRVPNFSKRGTVVSIRNRMLEVFGKQLHFKAAFEPWNLVPVCTKLVKTLLHHPSREPTLARISGSLFREKDRSTMKIEVENDATDGLRTSNARRVSAEAYLKDSSDVESLIATFRPKDSDHDIRVVVGLEDRNEISVRKLVTASELDHVIHRFYKNC